jgi:hypothetical protein
MPKFLEEKLEASAAKAGKTGKAADRYVFGAMNNMGAMHGNKTTAKGERMEAKHTADMKKKKGGFAAKLGAQLKEAY